MKATAGFIVGLLTAAVIFVLIEDFADALGLSIGYLLLAVAMCCVVALPTVLVGGVPTWIVLKRRRIDSVVAFALAGSTLALVTHVLLIGVGLLRSDDPPETFLEALVERHRVVQLAAAIVAGCMGAVVFWYVAVKQSARKSEVSRRYES